MYFRLMNVIDVVAFIILTYGVLRGLNKGFVIEISGILAFALGLIGAFKFSNLGSKIFSNLIDYFSLSFFFIFLNSAGGASPMILLAACAQDCDFPASQLILFCL